MPRPSSCLTLIAGAFLFLTGCATPYDPTPNIHDVTDQAAVAKDVSDCAREAAQFHRQLSPMDVLTNAGSAAASNLSSAAAKMGWLGPALGGLGGAVNTVAQWIGLVDHDTPSAEQQCVRQRLDRDHAGILVEPTL